MPPITLLQQYNQLILAFQAILSENVSMAYFFEVWVASQRYHNSSPLTYAFSEEIAINSLVVVPLQDKSVIAVVSKETKRPSFPTKDILRLIELPPLPDYVE